MEAARFLKSKHPHSMVEVKDLQSGDVTAVALGRGERWPASSARPASAPGSTRTALTTPSTAGGWDVGRIYQTRGDPDSLCWFGR